MDSRYQVFHSDVQQYRNGKLVRLASYTEVSQRTEFHVANTDHYASLTSLLVVAVLNIRCTAVLYVRNVSKVLSSASPMGLDKVGDKMHGHLTV